VRPIQPAVRILRLNKCKYALGVRRDCNPDLSVLALGQTMPLEAFPGCACVGRAIGPLPGPPFDMLHGVRCACHRAAKSMLGFCGSKVTSMPPVFSSLYRTFSQVLPPSEVRKIPRSGFGPKGCPRAATKTISGLAG